MEWEYEKEGFEFGNGERYLPDFWLATVSMWAEVKSVPLTAEERGKCRLLADGSGYAVLMLVGLPRLRNYWAMEPQRPLPLDGPRVTDYVLTDRYLHEHRFYVCTGADQGTDAELSNWWISRRTRAAYDAARSARFEFGEAGGSQGGR